MSTIQPFLAHPSQQYKASFIEATYEYIQENLGISWNPDILEERFDEYIETMLSRASDPLQGFVPETTYWLIVNGDVYAGELGIRHHLNESLKRFGGHIGYKVRPTMRRMGYGKLMCQWGIQKARKLGITDILITCDDDNIGSQKIIEANGGILKDKIDNDRGVLTRRYWIYYR